MDHDLSYLIAPKRSSVSKRDSGNDAMHAVVTRANGGYEQLDYCLVPKPKPASNEVLIKVLAAGVNNTEINTRLGWYANTVKGGTDDASVSVNDVGSEGGWNASTPFPIIQGTDCCGEIVAVGDGIDPSRIGQRVLVRSCMRLKGFNSTENIWMASDFDGAFAEYVSVPDSEVFSIKSDWTDAELATIPCAYGTAENMLERSQVHSRDTVLVTGASGGVGSAVVQLAKRRGAKVIGIVNKTKTDQALALGVDHVFTRDDNLVDLLGEESVSVIVDNVGGAGFAQRIKLLQRGGRYVSSGAIAGALVEFDMRDFYLRDLTFIGCTAWEASVFPNVVSYIERHEIKPLLAKTFPLKEIATAQKEFMLKEHFGNFVLIP